MSLPDFVIEVQLNSVGLPDYNSLQWTGLPFWVIVAAQTAVIAGR